MKTAIEYKIKNNPIISPEWLKDNRACQDGYDWAVKKIGVGIPLSEFLPMFDRADWMLWTLRKADALEKIQHVQCAILCAESVIDIYEKEYPGDDRPRKAIESAIAYVKDPTEKNRRAAYAAYAAYTAAYAASAASAAYAAPAAYAASAASAAASAAADADRAASAAAASAAADRAASAAAASAAAAYADRAAAGKSHHKKLCAMILEFIRGKK